MNLIRGIQANSSQRKILMSEARDNSNLTGQNDAK